MSEWTPEIIEKAAILATNYASRLIEADKIYSAMGQSDPDGVVLIAACMILVKGLRAQIPAPTPMLEVLDRIVEVALGHIEKVRDAQAHTPAGAKVIPMFKDRV